MEQKLETIAAMREQEARYRAGYWVHIEQFTPMGKDSHDQSYSCFVDVECREKMTAWAYQVADFCKYQHDTAEIAISILDRFLCTWEGRSARTKRDIFQLASITALYISVKMNEMVAMGPALISRLSRDTHTAKQVEQMERRILKALNWLVNPPTSRSFVRLLLGLLPSDFFESKVRQVIHDLSNFQLEVAVGIYDLVTVPKSIVAFSALVNALWSVGLENHKVVQVETIFANALGIVADANYIVDVETMLYQLVDQVPLTKAMGNVREGGSDDLTCESDNTYGVISPRSGSARRNNKIH